VKLVVVCHPVTVGFALARPKLGRPRVRRMMPAETEVSSTIP
jgi:hypothetical protein